MNNENQKEQPTHDGPNWKWWHFVLAGILIASWSIWRWWETRQFKHLSGLVLAGLCLLVGLGSRGKKDDQ